MARRWQIFVIVIVDASDGGKRRRWQLVETDLTNDGPFLGSTITPCVAQEGFR